MATRKTNLGARRFFKFSLTTFLVAFAVIAIGLGVIVQRVHEHQEAVAAVRQWERTSIIYDHQLDWSNRSVDMGAQPATDTLIARLFGDDAVITPEQLTVNDLNITDNDITHLQALTRLSVLV